MLVGYVRMLQEAYGSATNPESSRVELARSCVLSFPPAYRVLDQILQFQF